MTQYFAMLNDSCQGPFRLDQLNQAGVRPDTYVWSKNMTDWEKAIDVEEIRDYYRDRLSEKRDRNASAQTDTANKKNMTGGNSIQQIKGQFSRYGIDFPVPEEEEDLDRPPVYYVVPAIILTLFCFPITGAMAIYYSIKSRKEWEFAVMSESEKSRELYTPEERLEYKRNARYYERMAKMWIGITFFIGVIVYATVIGNM